MATDIPQSVEEKHRNKMLKKKKIVDERIAQATEQRGVLILLKGTGKGKSSSAFGTMARALGHGQKAGVIQFIKGRQETGEHLFFNNHPQVDFHVMGHGFTWETQDINQDIDSAKQAWVIAKKMLQDERYNILVFDELSYMFKYKYLDINECVKDIVARPIMQNLIITGRTMHTELQKVADTISDVQNIQHAFKLGVKAQQGIEW